MIESIIFEIVKAAVIAIASGVMKMWLNQRSMKQDLDIAFDKIRALENKNGSNNPPSSKAPQ